MFMITLTVALLLIGIVVGYFISRRVANSSSDSFVRLETLLQTQAQQLTDFRESLNQNFSTNRAQLDKRQLETLSILQDSVQKNMGATREEIAKTLSRHTDELGKRVDKLTDNTNERLKEISGQVDKRLTEGFEKTQATFGDVVKRLALIDVAQKKITELSSNVVSLQDILADRKSRGAFGEVQLSALIRNMLPEKNFSFQHTLSNGMRVDCMLFLPEPTGNVAIDSKFPLETYQRMLTLQQNPVECRQAEQQFRRDIKKHIDDIASKYIIPGETADGAVMFIPAEAVFAEIHANYSDLVTAAHQARVWLASPTTMMAIINTARAVLKDAATREQIHVIQEHLQALAKDFDRFQQRMDKLATHIDQAHQDVKQVHTSAKKITSRFNKIEKVELLEETVD